MLPALWNDSVPASITGGPIHRLSSIFDRMMDEAGHFAEACSGVPMAMWEDEDRIGIEVELPGLTDQDVEITVHHGRLFIRGERKPEDGRTPSTTAGAMAGSSG
jgi:HSP20 family molecular chaperone IbpA